jgi:hypothetical protein
VVGSFVELELRGEYFVGEDFGRIISGLYEGLHYM